jgi:hypothetical protein
LSLRAGWQRRESSARNDRDWIWEADGVLLAQRTARSLKSRAGMQRKV